VLSLGPAAAAAGVLVVVSVCGTMGTGMGRGTVGVPGKGVPKGTASRLEGCP
jgi:hypothetical protein